MLFSKPARLDDCLDITRSGHADSVRVRTEESQWVGDTDIIRQWIAVFDWRLPKKEIVCRAVCGMTRSGDGPAVRKALAAEANRRLADLLRKVHMPHADVNYAGGRFQAMNARKREANNARKLAPSEAAKRILASAPGIGDRRDRVVNGNRKGIRDYLAVDRTVLANERTFLAYLRTALAFLIAGLTLIQFFNSPVMAVVGWALLPVGPASLGIGLRRYLRMRRLIRLPDGPAQGDELDRTGPAANASSAGRPDAGEAGSRAQDTVGNRREEHSGSR